MGQEFVDELTALRVVHADDTTRVRWHVETLTASLWDGSHHHLLYRRHRTSLFFGPVRVGHSLARIHQRMFGDEPLDTRPSGPFQSVVGGAKIGELRVAADWRDL